MDYDPTEIKVVAPERKLKSKLTPFKISIIYMLVGGSWLFFGDNLIPVFNNYPILSTAIHILMDFLFIAISAFMLYSMTYYSEMALIKNAASLANAQRIAHIGSGDWDIVRNELIWSEETSCIFGVDPEGAPSTFEGFLNLIHPEDKESVKRSMDEALFKNIPFDIDFRIVRSDGRERIVHGHAEVTSYEDGKPTRMTGTVQDVTEQKRAESELKKLSMAMEHSVNVIMITNVKGDIEYVNPMFEQVTGWTREEVIGQNPKILASGETTREEYNELWDTIRAGKTWRGVFKNKKKNGQFYWGNGVITPIKNEKGEMTHFLAVQEDITEKKICEERIQYLAYYDDMTGLINRARFMELLSEWIYSQSKSGTGVLLLINVDEFKFINDTYGHGVGDELLRRIAGVMQGSLTDMKMPDGVILGRMGGDEFAIFLPHLGAKEGMDVAEKIRGRIETFRLMERSFHTSVSISVVLYPEHGVTTKELFTRVDAAMHRTKEMGRNRCHLYRPEDRDLENIHSRLKEKESIRKALEEDRFVPWFQPILDLRDGKIHHYETLARMRDEDGGILSPGVFIETAERFGLIGDIDRIITEKTMRLQADTGRKGRYLSFGMNLSANKLGDEEFLSFLQSRILETGADPSHLIFEITETAAVHDLERAIKFINSLKSMGCRFSLDDFGVGFTSFVYLREMQVDYIKIDGSFIRKMHENPNDRLFVKAITEVAKGMGIKTIAEFVELEETVRLLKDYGVDYAQGYFIGKPAPELLS